jgi:hypothetical protein
LFIKRGVLVAERLEWWKGIKDLELDIETLDGKVDE